MKENRIRTEKVSSTTKIRIKELEANLPIIRMVRFKEVIFSFRIMDLRSIGIGEELVTLIRNHKKKIQPELQAFKLPKIVRIIVWMKNPFSEASCGTFGGYLPMLDPPVHMCLNTDNLIEEETMFLRENFEARASVVGVLS